MSDNVKVVIPARFGSTRLPGKPLLTIAGKPVFWHVYQRVLEAGILASDITLATDDINIQKKAAELNIHCLMTSQFHESGTDRLNEVAEKLQWGDETLVINVQGDEPLVPSEIISKLVKFSRETSQFDIFTVATKITCNKDLLNPNIVKVVMSSLGHAIYFSRAPIPFNRDLASSLDCYYRHVGIYAYTVQSLKDFCSCSVADIEKIEKLEQLRALNQGLSIGVTIVEKAPPHGIDTEADYLFTKRVMESVK